LKLRYRTALAALIVCTTLPAFAVPLPARTQAPTFARPDLDGRTVSLAAYRGRLVLVDFWASWCAPCIVEIPRLMALQKNHAGMLKIIGVSMDDDAASARKVAAQYHFNYPVVMGDAAFGKLYGGILGLPAIFLVGRDGKVIQSWRGDFRPASVEARVEAALK
jgi:peroxiredoxin